MRKKEVIVITPLVYKTRNEPEFLEYIRNWCLYFYPQNERFSYFPDDQVERKYREMITTEFDGSDPVDISIKKVFLKKVIWQ